MKSFRLFLTACFVILFAAGCTLRGGALPTRTPTPAILIQARTSTPQPYVAPTAIVTVVTNTKAPATARISKASTLSPYPAPAGAQAAFTSSPTFPPNILTPIPTGTPFHPTPTPGITFPGSKPDPQQIIDPADLAEGNSVLHNLILIETQWSFPFSSEYRDEFEDQTVFTGEGLSDTDHALWAISPDGTRMGRLTPIGMNAALYLPTSAEQKALVVEYGVHFNHPDLIPVSLPAECYETSETPDPCQNFKFSPDGRYLSYTFDEIPCNRTMNIQETATGRIAYQGTVNGYTPEYVLDDRAFVKAGHCEGGSTLLVDLKTGKVQKASGWGHQYVWNHARSAFMVHDYPYQGYAGSTFWGYNLQTGRLFSGPEINHSMDSPAVWTPDGAYILYEHRDFVTVGPGLLDAPKGASQILRLELASGKSQVIISDPRYDYWLCGVEHRARCQFKHPEWVQIALYPVPTDPAALERYQSAVVRCLQRENCLPNPELRALNWRTGELLPWEQSPAAPPTSTPEVRYGFPEDGKPRPPHPDEQPLYRRPSGEYAFYRGADGYSLWKVVDGFPPVMWVESADHYLYLP